VRGTAFTRRKSMELSEETANSQVVVLFFLTKVG